MSISAGSVTMTGMAGAGAAGSMSAKRDLRPGDPKRESPGRRGGGESAGGASQRSRRMSRYPVPARSCRVSPAREAHTHPGARRRQTAAGRGKGRGGTPPCKPYLCRRVLAPGRRSPNPPAPDQPSTPACRDHAEPLPNSPGSASRSRTTQATRPKRPAQRARETARAQRSSLRWPGPAPPLACASAQLVDAVAFAVVHLGEDRGRILGGTVAVVAWALTCTPWCLARWCCFSHTSDSTAIPICCRFPPQCLL